MPVINPNAALRPTPQDVTTNAQMLQSAPPRILQQWYESGRWYTPQYPNPGSGNLNSSVATGTQIFVPDNALEAVTLNALAVNVLTASSAGKLQLGIYSVHPVTGMPDQLLANTSVLDGSATGCKQSNITALKLAQGQKYYRSVLVTGGDLGLQFFQGTTVRQMRGLTDPASQQSGIGILNQTSKSSMTAVSGTFNEVPNASGMPVIYVRAQ